MGILMRMNARVDESSIRVAGAVYPIPATPAPHWATWLTVSDEMTAEPSETTDVTADPVRAAALAAGSCGWLESDRRPRAGLPILSWKIPGRPDTTDHRSEADMAKTTRTTHRSVAGKKLYAVRDEKGRIKDIQTYERAHRADIRRKSKAETTSAAKKTK
jgi:hypothetical protein